MSKKWVLTFDFEAYDFVNVNFQEVGGVSTPKVSIQYTRNKEVLSRQHDEDDVEYDLITRKGCARLETSPLTNAAV